MKDEYIIINSTALQKRIEELKKQAVSFIPAHEATICYKKLDELNKILSQSTPLIPEIEKAFQQGVLFCQSPLENINLKNHISNLKLDI